MRSKMERNTEQKGFFGRITNRITFFLHNKELKHKLYVIIFESDTRSGKLFDMVLLGFIVTSVLVVILDSVHAFSIRFSLLFTILESIFAFFFTVEYLLRIYCSPRPRAYIFSFFGIIDLLATLALYLSFFITGTHYLLVIRAFRLIRIFRIFHLFNYQQEGNLLLVSLRLSSPKILVFFLFVLILVTAIGTLMYMIEGSLPNSSFDNIPNSIYWAIVTLTTVGYGDITPLTSAGRFLSAIVMLIGYTIIAVPTGIVSATMAGERRRRRDIACPLCGRREHEPAAEFCQYCGARLDREENKRKIKGKCK